MPEVQFAGSAGLLEGKYLFQKDPGAPIAVLLHPHPRFQGSMNNLFMYQCYHALHHRGYSVMRFNFRGVGKSQGSYDDGVGELADAAAALDWMEERRSQASGAMMVGFSFGAWVGMQLMARRPEITRFVCLAPPAGIYDFSFISTDYCQSTGLVVGGEWDAIAPVADVATLVEYLNATKKMVDHVTIPKANHFFDGCVPAVLEEVTRWLEKSRETA
jgi:alpha/beta superfamily hydrolase